jgi:pilus assembly protein Flp/PilA
MSATVLTFRGARRAGRTANRHQQRGSHRDPAQLRVVALDGNAVAQRRAADNRRPLAGQRRNRMTQLIKKFVREDEGQDLIEYILLGSLIAIVVVAGAGTLGTNINTWYTDMATWVSTQSAAIP